MTGVFWAKMIDEISWVNLIGEISWGRQNVWVICFLIESLATCCGALVFLIGCYFWIACAVVFLILSAEILIDSWIATDSLTSLLAR